MSAGVQAEPASPRSRPTTIRHAFYQAEVAGVVPKTEAGYDQVGRDLLRLRRSGRVPYECLEAALRYLGAGREWARVPGGRAALPARVPGGRAALPRPRHLRHLLLRPGSPRHGKEALS
jgi:hypothetical protein